VPPPKTVDAYLAAAPKDKRDALAVLRRTIKASAPSATEVMAYGLVGYKYEGKPLIYIGYAKTHCAVYGYSSFAHEHPELFKKFDVDKGTIRFQPDSPIPPRLVTRMVKSRMKEIDAGGASSYAKRSKAVAASASR